MKKALFSAACLLAANSPALSSDAAALNRQQLGGPPSIATSASSSVRCHDAFSWQATLDGKAFKDAAASAVPANSSDAQPKVSSVLKVSFAPVGSWSPSYRGPGVAGLPRSEKARLLAKGPLYAMELGGVSSEVALAHLRRYGAYGGWLQAPGVVVFRARPERVSEIAANAARDLGISVGSKSTVAPGYEYRLVTAQSVSSQSIQSVQGVSGGSAVDVFALLSEGRGTGSAKGMVDSLGDWAEVKEHAGGYVVRLGRMSRVSLSEFVQSEGGHILLAGGNARVTAGSSISDVLRKCGAGSIGDRFEVPPVAFSDSRSLLFLTGGAKVPVQSEEQLLFVRNSLGGRGIEILVVQPR